MRRPSETMSLCNDFARGVADSRNTFPRPDLVESVRIGLGEIAPTSCVVDERMGCLLELDQVYGW